jgi:hypothetical protein
MLTGSTSTEEQNIALRRLQQGGGEGGKEIRVSTLSFKSWIMLTGQLCYVTASLQYLGWMLG